METVTVRKKQSWRWGIRLLTGFFVLVMTVLCLYAKLDLGLSVLLCGPVLAPMTALLWYYERWCIIFGPGGIRWRGTLRPWTQVERVWESWSVSELRVVSIRFRDGKTLRFRMEEEHAQQARRLICRRCSIETR